MTAVRRERQMLEPVSALRAWKPRFREHLRDPRFWMVQALVLVATLGHGLSEITEAFTEKGGVHLCVVLMYGLYFVPIIYASLYFGMDGAVPTAIWAGALAVPNIIFTHEGYERLAEALQLVIIIALAIVVASRVDREITARRDAESSAAAQQLSEAKYHALFDVAGDAILVFDRAGVIREANAAAGSLFDIPPRDLQRRGLAEVIGDEAAHRLLENASGGHSKQHELRWIGPHEAEVWLEPVCSLVSTGGELVYQAIFRDVTDRWQRQRGLEAYARQIMAAQEEERRRISHELHDGPLQSLIILCRRLDASAEAHRGNRSSAKGSDIDEARSSAEAIAAEIRRLSRDLRPSILDDLGLVPAIRWLVKDLEQRTGLRTRLMTSDGDRRIASDAELGLFRIAQEALRNVERHAGATQVIVSLTIDDDRTQLVVEDDGCGMETIDLRASAAASGRLGLLGMHERARLCGGSLAVVSAPGKGARIEAILPNLG
jgi:PAS domain S-box-containing protein